MSSRPWYPFYWSDYSGKTLHLTMSQHGAYILLLRWVYTTGKPVPHKRRYSIAQASLDSERSDVEAMLAEFFVRKGDGWHSTKAEEVMQEAEIKHQKYVEAGRIGGKRRSSDASSDAQAMFNYPQPDPHPPSKINNKSLFNGNGIGNGNGQHTTIKDPQDRLERFSKKLAESFSKDGWLIVFAARDPTSPEHARCLELCKIQARDVLHKGWPLQWTT